MKSLRIGCQLYLYTIKLVVLYCKQLGINYKNLSDEEFRWLIRILKKSKKMGTPISQRKKR